MSKMTAGTGPPVGATLDIGAGPTPFAERGVGPTRMREIAAAQPWDDAKEIDGDQAP